jgi:hypothetical protein
LKARSKVILCVGKMRDDSLIQAFHPRLWRVLDFQ